MQAIESTLAEVTTAKPSLDSEQTKTGFLDFFTPSAVDPSAATTTVQGALVLSRRIRRVQDQVDLAKRQSRLSGAARGAHDAGGGA